VFTRACLIGSTVPHLHTHLIPRYHGEQDDPRGGVRWIMLGKVGYWTACSLWCFFCQHDLDDEHDEHLRQCSRILERPNDERYLISNDSVPRR
jgi:hypothetical protein